MSDTLDVVDVAQQAGPGQDLAPVPVDERKVVRGYPGATIKRLTEGQAKLLSEQLPDGDHDILPTGEVYVSQVHYRRVLNKAFGPGGWALIPRGGFSTLDGVMMREYALFAEGRWLAEAVGQAEYQEKNDRMTWADAAEAVKSNAIMRCCKDLGVASECWDRRFTEQFQDEYCVRVWRPGKRPQWRRKDARPWYDETGVVEGTAGDAPQAAPPATLGDVEKELLAAADAVAKLLNMTPSEAMTRASAFFGKDHKRKDERMDYEERWLGKAPLEPKVMSFSVGDIASGRTKSDKWKGGALGELRAVIKKNEGPKGEPAPKADEKREPGAEG